MHMMWVDLRGSLMRTMAYSCVSGGHSMLFLLLVQLYDSRCVHTRAFRIAFLLIPP